MRGSCCRRSSSREQSPRLHTPSSLQGPPTLQSQQQQRRLSSRPAPQREQIKGDAVRACVRGSSGGAWGSGKRRIWAAERGAPFWVALVGAGICRKPQARSRRKAGRQAPPPPLSVRKRSASARGGDGGGVAGRQPGTRQRWKSNWQHGFGKAVAQLREERGGREERERFGFANLPAVRWFCSGAEKEEVVVAGRRSRRIGDRRARSSGRPDPSARGSATQFCCEL